ncbi:elongation factor P maturation arginine rhamnosyltransferase EarP [Parasulfuritortus cantonensis]
MWAGKPLVWQAYRQEDQAHWPKIHASSTCSAATWTPATRMPCGPVERLERHGRSRSAWPKFGTGARPGWPGWTAGRPSWTGRRPGHQFVKFCNEKSK